MSRVIAWFSCGVPSTVALHYALYDYGSLAFPAYTITGSEHPDNKRYMEDVEKSFNVKVKKIKSNGYKSIDDVFVRTKFLRGQKGASGERL